MRYSWTICISLLLIVDETSFADARLKKKVLDTIHKLRDPRNKNCENSDYKHDPALSSKLNGYFYNLYTSSAFPSNLIIKLAPKGNDTIFARSTHDGECCRTVNFTLGEDYNTYTIASESDCSTKISEDAAHQKLIVANEEETDGSCCIIMWACRKSREGVHTLCDKRMISQEQNEWIHRQYDQMGLKPIKDEQSTEDLKGGKCFKN